MLEIVPMTLREANAFVEQNHRHHGATVGHKFSIGLSDGEKIVGVAIVGRPVSRHLDDGWTLEVNRLCTDGTRNACSMLYAAAWRAARAMGYTAAQLTASTRGKRSKKIKETEPKQKNLNDKNARRYFTQTANLNFGSDPEALHVTATYSGKYLPDTVEQAEQEATNFLRRVQYRRKKEGLPPLKYMIVTAYTTKRNSETPVRIHHHIIMNGGLDRDVVEDLWRKRRRKGQKKGDKIGFCNADRLQADENGIAALCTYLVKQGCGKKRWNSSHNLERPYSRTNDGKYNRRQIEKWAKEHPPREFWEKKYPGWTLTDDDYGVQYEYNDFTGWAVYLKLRKKE